MTTSWFAPQLLCELFNIIVRPGLEYGVEIWGAEYLAGHERSPTIGHPDTNQLYLGFLRQVLGVRRSTPTAVVLFELGQWPLWCRWGKLVARYWERVWELPATRLVRQAVALSLEMAAPQGPMTPPHQLVWAAQVQRFLQSFESHTFPDAGPLRVQADAVQAAGRTVYTQWLRDSSSSKIKSYFQLRCDGNIPSSPSMAVYLRVLHTPSQRRVLARFRTGSHELMVEVGRYTKVPRVQRFCPCCTPIFVVEDEQHMIFHCPLYSEIRTQFEDLFAPPVLTGSVFTFLGTGLPARLAEFIEACCVRRTERLGQLQDEGWSVG